MKILTPFNIGKKSNLTDVNIRYLLIVFFSIASISIGSLIGPAGFLFSQEAEIPFDLLLSLRFPRSLLAFIVGSGLATTGVVLQSYFRNDLASPFTLGIASAASLAACISITISDSVLGSHVSAALGAGFGILLILFFSNSRNLSSATILLLGVSMSLLCSSAIFFLQLFSGPEKSFQMTRWLAGTLQGADYLWLIAPSIIIPICVLFFFTQCRNLDLLQIGHNFATGRGVDTWKCSLLLISACSLVVGITVSTCGPIGFVGLIIPNIVRRYCGSVHKELLFYSCFLGGFFLLAMDIIGRTVFIPQEIPVGLLSSIVGAPIFIVLILLKR